jgi:predicted Zn-dependent protease
MKLRVSYCIIFPVALAILAAAACKGKEEKKAPEVKEAVFEQSSFFRVPEDSTRWVEYLSPAPQDTARAWMMLGVLYLANNHAEVALNYFNEALHWDPGRPVLQLNLADAYNRLGQREKAIEAFKAFLRYDPASQFGPEIFRIVEKYHSLESENLIP